MTTTNRAFIKAYRDAAGSEVRTADSADSPRIGHAPQSSVELIRPPATEPPVNRNPGPAGPATHLPHAANRPHAKQPLSSYLGRLGRPLTRSKSEIDFLRPGTTVASFQWPVACRRLTQRFGQDLDRVTDLLVEQAAAGRSVVALIGLQPGAGTSTIAMSVAARLAKRNRRVILVEGNFAHPQLAEALGAVPTVGFEEVLNCTAPLADAIVRAEDDGLDLLALSAATPDAARLLNGLQVVVAAGALRHAYDLALVDAGAFQHAASQPLVADMIRTMGLDAAIIVASTQPTDEHQLETLAEQITSSGCELLGVIENRVANTEAA